MRQQSGNVANQLVFYPHLEVRDDDVQQVQELK
jgi:hypothetical protein